MPPIDMPPSGNQLQRERNSNKGHVSQERLSPFKQLFSLFPIDVLKSIRDSDRLASSSYVEIEWTDQNKDQCLDLLEKLCFKHGVTVWKNKIKQSHISVKKVFQDLKRNDPSFNYEEWIAKVWDEEDSTLWTDVFASYVIECYEKGNLHKMLQCCEIDTLNSLCFAFGFQEDTTSKFEIARGLIEEILIEGTRDVLNGLSVSFLHEINTLCHLHHNSQSTKKELIDKLLFLAFPAIDPRPHLDENITMEDLLNNYSVPELQSFCDLHRLKPKKSKLKLAKAIYNFYHNISSEEEQEKRSKPMKRKKAPSKKKTPAKKRSTTVDKTTRKRSAKKRKSTDRKSVV